MSPRAIKYAYAHLRFNYFKLYVLILCFIILNFMLPLLIILGECINIFMKYNSIIWNQVLVICCRTR